MELNRPLVSIIVPVYNAEKYIRRCIDSIKSQSLTDWELILIDDGSPDGSSEICNEYSNDDNRISVIHKTNGGVASARECGQSKAQGTYSIHVDPDDWIEPDMLKTLYDKAIEENVDMVISDFLFDYGPSHQVVSPQRTDGRDLLYNLLCQNLHGSLCNKLIRTELYSRYNLHFPENMICWEDLYICCNIAMHPCSVSCIPQALYHYDLHSNEQSMTRMATHKTLEAMKLFCNYFSNRLEIDRQHWLNEAKSSVLVTAYRCNLLNENDLRSLYPEINQWFINKYRRKYDMVFNNALAQVLSGKSMRYGRRYQKLNGAIQRIIVKFHNILYK